MQAQDDEEWPGAGNMPSRMSHFPPSFVARRLSGAKKKTQILNQFCRYTLLLILCTLYYLSSAFIARVAKETYECDKRDLWIWQKRPVNVTKETYECDKRDLWMWQKRPIHMTKETYECDKRDLQKKTYYPAPPWGTQYGACVYTYICDTCKYECMDLYVYTKRLGVCVTARRSVCVHTHIYNTYTYECMGLYVYTKRLGSLRHRTA